MKNKRRASILDDSSSLLYVRLHDAYQLESASFGAVPPLDNILHGFANQATAKRAFQWYATIGWIRFDAFNNGVTE